MADRLQVFDAQVGFQLAFTESLTILIPLPIIATLHATTALAPALLTMLALTALAMGLMGLLAGRHLHQMGHRAGDRAKRLGEDLVPARVLIALHEPPLRSMTGRRADAPSRAPPSCRHLLRLTAPPSPDSAALPGSPGLSRRC